MFIINVKFNKENQMKKITIVTMMLTLVLLLTGCNNGDDENQCIDDQNLSSTTLYLNNWENNAPIAAADINYSCDGGTTCDGDLITSGTTDENGTIAINYLPGSDLTCTLEIVDQVALFLYDSEGPVTDAYVQCSNYVGDIGQNGSIHNFSNDTCYITLTIN